MNCEKCGKQIPGNINYCPTCKMHEIQGTNNAQNQVINTTMNANEEKLDQSGIREPNQVTTPNTGKFIPFVIILLVIGSIGYFVINQFDIPFFSHNAENNENSNDVVPEMVSVPYATVSISGRTLITADMISTKEVAKNIVDTNQNIITGADRIIGKYVRNDKIIEEGKLFETSLLMTELDPSDLITIKSIPDGMTIYILPVDIRSSFNNSIMPGDKIDIYIQAINDSYQNIYVKLIEDVEILQTRDAEGNNAFGPVSTGTTSALIFPVPDQQFQILYKASRIQTNSVRIVPVPKFKEYSIIPGATEISSTEMTNFINSK